MKKWVKYMKFQNKNMLFIYIVLGIVYFYMTIYVYPFLIERLTAYGKLSVVQWPFFIRHMVSIITGFIIFGLAIYNKRKYGESFLLHCIKAVIIVAVCFWIYSFLWLALGPPLFMDM